MREFYIEWKRLALLGRCDAIGGAEYVRVLRLWEASGRTIAVARFIETHANECGWSEPTTSKRKAGAQ